MNLPYLSREKTTKPMMRWWIPAALVDEAEIKKELLEAKEAGFGGLEICVNMADSAPTPEELKAKGWATPRWNQLYKFILKTANAIGLRIDTTLSPAWPPSITGITPEDNAASKELSLCATEVFRKEYSGPMPTKTCDPNSGMKMGGPSGPPEGPPGIGNAPDLPNKPELQCVIAAKVLGDVDVTKEQSINWGDMPLITEAKTRKTTLLDPDSLTLVPCAGEVLTFRAPDDGNWILFAAWMQGTCQTNKQGNSTFDPCLVIDHFGDAGANALIQFWEDNLLDDETRMLLRENGGTFFEDSMEVSTSRGCFHWSVDLAERFEEKWGYDIRKFIPLLHGLNVGGMSNVDLFTYELGDETGNVSPLGDQIRRDFKQIITEGFVYHHIQPIQRWCKTLGQGFRCQCYSGLHDTSLSSAICVGPEGESLGFGPGVQGDDRFRLVSGGAHMNLRNTITDEVGALANEGYRLTWLEMLHWINKNFCGGANQMIFHGYPYAESSISKWPGYSPFGFGLGGYWGSREPGWEHISAFTGYLTRVQTLLHQGKPSMDFAVLSHKYGTLAPILKDQTLAELGYTYDIITPSVLELDTAVLKDGMLCPDGPGYRALVIQNESALPLSALKKLLMLSQQNFPVIFCGNIPEMPSYFTDDMDEYHRISEKLAETCLLVPDTGCLPEVMMRLGIAARFSKTAPISVIHRADSLRHYYCLWNHGETAVDTTASLAGSGYVSRMEPWSGEAWATESQFDGTMFQVPVHILPEEFQIYVVGPEQYPAKKVAKDAGVTIDHCDLTIRRYEDAGNPEHPAATRFTTVNAGNISLKPWDQLDNLPKEICGVGTYTAEFIWEYGDSGILKLENGHFCGISLCVNDVPVPFDHYTKTAYIAGLLRPGRNTLQIKLSSTLGNQLIHDGSISAPVWCPENAPVPESFGIWDKIVILALAG